MATRLGTLIGRALLPRRRPGFARDESGVTAVEFGLLALPFFSIIGAILETSLVFLSGQVLESAVQDTSRMIRTGQIQAAGMNAAGFKSLVCGRLYGLFSDCSELHVEVRLLDNFNDATISPPITCNAAKVCNWNRPENFTPGQGSAIVVVQVYYRWPTILPFGGIGLNNLADGRRIMGAATVFRNEPFVS